MTEKKNSGFQSFSLKQAATVTSEDYDEFIHLSIPTEKHGTYLDRTIQNCTPDEFAKWVAVIWPTELDKDFSTYESRLRVYNEIEKKSKEMHKSAQKRMENSTFYKNARNKQRKEKEGS